MDGREDEVKYFIEISLSKRIEELESKLYLSNISFSKHDNLWEYRFIFENESSLKNFKNYIIKNFWSEVNSFNVNLH